VASLSPTTVVVAGKIFGVILADLAAGKSPNQITASVRAAMSGAPTTRSARAPVAKAQGGTAAGCCGKAHHHLKPAR
jgi:hypothetical protein